MAFINLGPAGRVPPKLAKLPLAALSPIQLRSAQRTLTRCLVRTSSLLPDIVALELLLVVALLVFRPAIQDGLVYHEADTSTMFYPVFAALGSALARGELALWSPHLFSGFPLLAEGQTGVLYPPNWLAATFSTQSGFIWLRVAHFAAGSIFAYFFARVIRLSVGSAAILAMSFTYGSFMVGQMQHASVVASAIWMPLVLGLAELGFQSAGRRQFRWFSLSGLALGLSALGVHGQTVIMTGGCFMAWVAFRLLFPPPRPNPFSLGDTRPTWASSGVRLPRRWRVATAQRASRLRLGRIRNWTMVDWPGELYKFGVSFGAVVRAGAKRLRTALWAGLLVPLIGITVAAGQLLPLYELSRWSGRAGSWSYQAATDYSLPVQNLLTLVFPFFFRDGHGGGWSLWQPWEVTFHAGSVSLALALLGLLCARRREVFFFAALLITSTLLALGDYSPWNLYAQVWDLPGFNLQRAPARFTYLAVFSLAGLAGLGSQVLWERLRAWPNGARQPLRLVLIWILALVASLALLVWHLLSWRHWLETEPIWALRLIEEHYLGLRHDPGAVESAQRAYSGLWQALDLTNARTALPLFLLLALLLLVVCWNEFRRARVAWQTLLVVLVALDLVSFAQAFHPTRPIEAITDVGPAGRFLAAQPTLSRVLTDPNVADPRANELLAWQVAEVRAYDPLELSRHRVFLGSVSHVDNWLLDLLGVTHRVLPAEQPGLPSYRQTGFHPQHPLVSGTANNPSGVGAWRIGGEPVDELRVVTALEDGFTIGDGEPVGEWLLTDSSGRQRVLSMLAGRDTAEWTYDDPVYSAQPAHARAQVAFTYELPIPLSNGARQATLYYTAFPLPDSPRIERAEFRYIHPRGRMQVFGFGFLDRRRGQVLQFFESEKYRTVYSQGGVLIRENQSAFPRAFAVPEAVLAGSAYDALEMLAHGTIQPRRQVVLESDSGASVPAPKLGPVQGDRLGEPYGDVNILSYENEALTVRASTEGGYLIVTDAYYPGWRAYLDGEEVPLFRANYLFRGIELPPGSHIVQFRYEPESFRSGIIISRLALALVTLGLALSFAPLGRLRPSVWVRASGR